MKLIKIILPLLATTPWLHAMDEDVLLERKPIDEAIVQKPKAIKPLFDLCMDAVQTRGIKSPEEASKVLKGLQTANIQKKQLKAKLTRVERHNYAEKDFAYQLGKWDGCTQPQAPARVHEELMTTYEHINPLADIPRHNHFAATSKSAQEHMIDTLPKCLNRWGMETLRTIANTNPTITLPKLHRSGAIGFRAARIDDFETAAVQRDFKDFCLTQPNVSLPEHLNSHDMEIPGRWTWRWRSFWRGTKNTASTLGHNIVETAKEAPWTMGFAFVTQFGNEMFVKGAQHVPTLTQRPLARTLLYIPYAIGLNALLQSIRTWACR